MPKYAVDTLVIFFTAVTVIGVFLFSLRRALEEKERVDDLHRRSSKKGNSHTQQGTNEGAITLTSAGGAAGFTIPFSSPARTKRRPTKITREGSSIIFGEIIGYRVWNLVGNYLVSWNGTIWLPDRPMTGYGLKFNNVLGIYSFSEPRDAYDLFNSYKGYTCSVAIGSIRMWGTVLVYDSGYRAEYARVERIMSIRRKGVEIIYSHEINKLYGLSEKPDQTLIGKTGWCGHGMMKSLCPQCRNTE